MISAQLEPAVRLVLDIEPDERGNLSTAAVMDDGRLLALTLNAKLIHDAGAQAAGHTMIASPTPLPAHGTATSERRVHRARHDTAGRPARPAHHAVDSARNRCNDDRVHPHDALHTRSPRGGAHRRIVIGGSRAALVAGDALVLGVPVTVASWKKHLAHGNYEDVALRAIVADDDALARRSIRDALHGAGITVACRGGIGREAVELALFYRPDVVVMDHMMPGIDGIEATRRLHQHDPSIRVVVLAEAHDDAIGLRAVRAGAVGFLSKEIDLAALPRTLRGVRDGEARSRAGSP